MGRRNMLGIGGHAMAIVILVVVVVVQAVRHRLWRCRLRRFRLESKSASKRARLGVGSIMGQVRIHEYLVTYSFVMYGWRLCWMG